MIELNDIQGAKWYLLAFLKISGREIKRLKMFKIPKYLTNAL